MAAFPMNGSRGVTFRPRSNISKRSTGLHAFGAFCLLIFMGAGFAGSYRRLLLRPDSRWWLQRVVFTMILSRPCSAGPVMEWGFAPDVPEGTRAGRLPDACLVHVHRLMFTVPDVQGATA